MSEIKFSIGIPTFNRLPYLKKAVDSCLNQILPDDECIEIIISDNNSSDGTSKYLQGIAELEIDQLIIKSIRHNQSIPPLSNWQTLLDHATGEYFLLLCDDDILHPEMSSHVIKALQDHANTKIFGMLTGFSKIDQHGKPYGQFTQKQGIMPSSLFFQKLSTRNIRYHWCAFISKTSLIKKSNVFKFGFPGAGACADGASILACCAAGGSIITIAKNLAEYRVHDGNDGSSENALVSAFSAREEFLKFAESIKVPKNLYQYTLYWCLDGLIYQTTKFMFRGVIDEKFRLNFQKFSGHYEKQLDSGFLSPIMLLLIKLKYRAFNTILKVVVLFKPQN